MDTLEIAKGAVGFVVSAGVTKIVNDIISNNINEPEKLASKVSTIAGAAVLGMMAKDASKVYVSTKIDQTAASVRAFKLKIAEAKIERSAQSSDPA